MYTNCYVWVLIRTRLNRTKESTQDTRICFPISRTSSLHLGGVFCSLIALSSLLENSSDRDYNIVNPLSTIRSSNLFFYLRFRYQCNTRTWRRSCSGQVRFLATTATQLDPEEEEDLIAPLYLFVLSVVQFVTTVTKSQPGLAVPNSQEAQHESSSLITADKLDRPI